MSGLRPRSALRKSQQIAYEQIMSGPATMLWLDMGSGKTGTSLTAIRDLLDWGYAAHVLVIAPLLVAEETWPDEIETWEHTVVLDYEVLTGDPDRRANRALRLPELSIINGENIPWLVEFWEERGGWPYDVVFIDEISRFKNPTKRNKPTKKQVRDVTERVLKALPRGTTEEDAENALRKELKKLRGGITRFGALCSVLPYIDIMVGLTGTPGPNGLIDIWAQFYLLDQGQRLGSNITAYKKRWFDSDYMGYKYEPKPHAFGQIVEAIRDITVSIESDAELPPVVYNTLRCKLPASVMKQYQKFERTLLLEEHDVKAVNEGVLTGKLLQLANGSVYRDNEATGEREVIEIHSRKLEYLDRVIEEANGKPVMVAYSYQFDLDKLKKKYPHAEVVGETKNLQKRWNAGEIQLLLAHPQSAGHGLNLQYGGCILVWYGLCWSLEYYQQLNKRLHRPGQTDTVFIHHIICEGTVDERVMKVLPDKAATQDMLIQATMRK